MSTNTNNTIRQSALDILHDYLYNKAMDYLNIHKKWKKYWQDNKTNSFDPSSKKPKYYCLEMFPYPSGATLHLGHFYMYALPDTHARYKRMAGWNVFHPFGYDAFGLPAENHALKTDTHPYDNTLENIRIFTEQIAKLGAMYDYDYSVTTCFPDYYKWTQWLFLQLYNSGAAYQKESPVNWCDKCKTVLANEQVISGECERCDSVVIRKNMKQWFFKITDFAEELLAGLETLDWPNKTKVMQKNWIGRSEGARVQFKIKNLDSVAEVFTTRIDTLPGATFLVLAPEHPLAQKLITSENKQVCGDYILESAKKSEVERQMQDRTKTGVFTGSYAINPLNNEEIPIWLADYVLASYGTGAIMAVPAHDVRDEEFAKKYNLEIRHVVDEELEANKQKILEQLSKSKSAEKSITYRLRDWGIGRQRYWGVPIPIIYCEQCGIVPVPEKDLPVTLPIINDFAPKGSSPLANVPEFVNCKCPKCQNPAKREVDTMDTFVCSSWYFLRYPDAKNPNIPFNASSPLLPVDKYIGGAEHACAHLLYARYITHFLHSKGMLSFKEPFTSLIHQGMVLARDGNKMSKSKGNTIAPDEYVNKYGSDILRLYMLFGFNFVDGGPWNDATLQSVMRFTSRVEALVKTCTNTPEQNKEVLYVLANTIKSVGSDLENFSFNTAVARCMELVNAIMVADIKSYDTVKTLVLLLAPMIPHLAEEYWEMLGEKPSILNQNFPTPNEQYLQRDEVEIAVQINSKIVARINVPSNAKQPEVEALCSDITIGKQIKKAVYIPNRLINFIV